jgi:ABC-type Fe3+/spermidine/putrescine transport system ATPase subunit
MALLELVNLNKTFEQTAVHNFSLTLDRGNILCLLGPSGCGKTTLLRLVAGLEKPDQGRILFEGLDVTEVPPHKRQFGMMFQDLTLFPHKCVYENISFGLHMLKQTPAQVRQRTQEMLEMVGMTDMAQRNVVDLSGGEQQRVALARSLAPRPELLMLDEPLGALDRALRERLLFEIRSILKQVDVTAIFVTHDQTEALTIGDVIAVMNQGSLVQVDTPEALYMHPKHTFVARFLGFQNLLPGKVTPDGGVETRLGTFYPRMDALKAHTSVALVLRPENGRITVANEDHAHLQLVEGTVARRIFTGQSYRVKVAVDKDLALTFDLPNADSPPNVGEEISLWIDTENSVAIPDI